MCGLDVSVFGLLICHQFAGNVGGILRTSLRTERTGPEELVLDENAIAVGGVEAESVRSLGVGRLDDSHGKWLWDIAGDLDVQTGLETIDQDSLVCGVPVVVQEVDHVVFGKIGIGDLAERVSEADQRSTTGLLRHVVVGLGPSRADQLLDGIKVVKDSGRGRRAVVEHEEDGTGDGIEGV